MTHGFYFISRCIIHKNAMITHSQLKDGHDYSHLHIKVYKHTRSDTLVNHKKQPLLNVYNICSTM